MANNNIADKLPPQNIEAEQSFLGSIMLDKNAIIKIADLVAPNDFYKDIHKISMKRSLRFMSAANRSTC